MKNQQLIFLLLIIAVVLVIANRNKGDKPLALKSGSAPFDPMALKSNTPTTPAEDELFQDNSNPYPLQAQEDSGSGTSSGDYGHGGGGSSDSGSHYFHTPAALVPQKVKAPLPLIPKFIRQKAPVAMRAMAIQTRANPQPAATKVIRAQARRLPASKSPSRVQGIS